MASAAGEWKAREWVWVKPWHAAPWQRTLHGSNGGPRLWFGAPNLPKN